MDLTLDLGEEKLNIRAAGAIIHENKILTHVNVNSDHCCLPGGRVELGENSRETIKREIQEELGKDIEIGDYMATIENFFEMEEKTYHEIFFLYKVEFANDEDKKINQTMDNIEGKDYLKYKWMDLDEIEKVNLLPACLKDILKAKEFPVHVVNDDLKNDKS